MSKLSVTIIILNWNGISDTLQLLKNLEEVTYSNFSVLVVDNASTDDSVGQIARYMEKNRRTETGKYKISILPLSKNYGFAEGNNKGLQQLLRERPDFYLLLNNDTIVSPDFLDRMIAAAESDEKVGALAPMIYFADKEGNKRDEIWYAGGWLNFYAGGAHHSIELPANNSAASIPTDFISGCCLLLRKEVVAKLDVLFDPAFFAYGEDVDLCMRIVKAGYSLALVPQSTIWHKLASSSGGPKSYNFWYYNVRNNFIVMSRYAAWYHWPVFILYFVFYKPVLWSIVGLIVRPRKDKYYRLIAIAHGTLDAIRHRLGKRKD